MAETIKIDNSDKIDNYWELAQEAEEIGDFNKVEVYCNKILEEAPKTYPKLSSVWLTKGTAVGSQSSLTNLRIEEAINCFSKAIDYAPQGKTEEIKKAASQVVHSLGVMLVTDTCEIYINDPSPDYAEMITNMTKILHHLSSSLLNKCGVPAKEYTAKIAEIIYYSCIEAYNNNIYKKYCENEKPNLKQLERYVNLAGALIDLIYFAIDLDDNDDESDIERWNAYITICTQIESAVYYEYENGIYIKYGLNKEAQDAFIDLIMTAHTELNKIDSSHVIPQRPKPSKTRGCYVATSVYGSYDCPQVWTLRRYRDYILAKTWYGRLFIHTYYAVSPSLVKWFGHTVWFKKIWRGKLDHIVQSLQSKGIKSTPYQDKLW